MAINRAHLEMRKTAARLQPKPREKLLKHNKTRKGSHPLLLKRKLKALRRNLLQRAGRVIRPQGKVVLSMSANTAVQNGLLHYLDTLDQAA
jgi:hypothetical protein